MWRISLRSCCDEEGSEELHRRDLVLIGLPAALAGHIAALTTLYERVPKAL